jgi:hypothetical protein
VRIGAPCPATYGRAKRSASWRGVGWTWARSGRWCTTRVAPSLAGGPNARPPAVCSIVPPASRPAGAASALATTGTRVAVAPMSMRPSSGWAACRFCPSPGHRRPRAGRRHGRGGPRGGPAPRWSWPSSTRGAPASSPPAMRPCAGSDYARQRARGKEEGRAAAAALGGGALMCQSRPPSVSDYGSGRVIWPRFGLSEVPMSPTPAQTSTRPAKSGFQGMPRLVVLSSTFGSDVDSARHSIKSLPAPYVQDGLLRTLGHRGRERSHERSPRRRQRRAQRRSAAAKGPIWQRAPVMAGGWLRLPRPPPFLFQSRCCYP